MSSDFFSTLFEITESASEVLQEFTKVETPSGSLETDSPIVETAIAGAVIYGVYKIFSDD